MLHAKIGSFVKKSDTTGNQVITGLGFRPQVVFYIGNGRESDGAHADARSFFGVTDQMTGEPGINAGLLWKDNYSTSLGSASQASARMDLCGDESGTIVSEGQLLAPLGDDGFTINWLRQDGLPRVISYLAIGGDEITNTNTFTTAVGTTTGNQTTSGAGFMPNFLMMYSTSSQSTDNAVSLQNVWGGFGAASAPTERAYMTYFAAHNTAAASAYAYRNMKTNELFGQITNTQRLEGDLVSFDVNGYTINWSTHDGFAARYAGLCLAGVKVKVGTFTQKPSTGEQTVAGIPFRPKGVIFFSAQSTSTTIANDMQNMYGFASAEPSNSVVWWGATRNASPTEADSYLDRTKAIKFMTQGTPTLVAEAAVTSMRSDSFVLNWTTADANERNIGYIAFGEEIKWGEWSQSQTFTYTPNTPPTVALDSPAEAAAVTVRTPDLKFTGTDTQDDDIRYNLQLWSTAENWYDYNWTGRVKVTVLASKVEEDIADFPVYVNLANLPAGFHANVNQTDARDIRVTEADGITEIPREVVFYSAASDAGELHFKGDVYNNADTDFYIYYGNASASDYAVDHAFGANNVWDSSYRAVYHLNQDPSSSTMASSTANNRALTAVGMTSNQKVAAKVGNGIDFIPNDYLYAADDAVFDIAGSYTVSAWVNLDNTPITGMPIIIKIGESGAYHNYYMDIDSAGRAFTGHFNGSTWVESPHTSNTQLTANGTTWYLVSGVYSSSAQTITTYINGVQDSQLTSVTGTPATSTQQFQVFAQSTASFYLDGKGDEVRVSAGVRSAGYLRTQYYNQNDASSFFVIGGHESMLVFLDEVSGTDAGFSGSPDTTDPFASGQQVTYTVQSGSLLAPRNVSLAVSQLGYINSTAVFGSTSTPNIPYRGQTFLSGGAATLAKIEVRLLKVNAPTDAVYMEIYTNNAGVPGTLLGTSVNQKSGSTLTASSDGEVVTFLFVPEISLSASTTYWFVIKRTGATDNTNHYRINIEHNGTTDPYANGKLYAYFNGAWAEDDVFDEDPYNDAYFKVFTGYNGAYFWRVRGIDPNGTDQYGDFSATRIFLVTAVRRRNFPLWV